MQFETLPEYDRDVKKLLKKYRTLLSDMDDVMKVLNIRPEAFAPFSFRLYDLGNGSCIVKFKRISSDSFKGRGSNSGFRLIYAYFKKEDRIVLTELYHKSEQENEDRKRIVSNFIKNSIIIYYFHLFCPKKTGTRIT